MAKISGIKYLFLFKFLFFIRFTLLLHGKEDYSFNPQSSPVSNSNADFYIFLKPNVSDLIFLNIVYVYNDGEKSNILKTIFKYVSNQATPYMIYKLLNKYVFGNYDYSDCRFNPVMQEERVVENKSSNVLNKYMSLYRQYVEDNSIILIEVSLPFPVLQDEYNYSSFNITRIDSGKKLKDYEVKEKIDGIEENEFYGKHVCEVEELLTEINSKKNINPKMTNENVNNFSLQIKSKEDKQVKKKEIKDKQKLIKWKGDKQGEKKFELYKDTMVVNLEKIKDEEIIGYIKVVEAYEPDYIYQSLFYKINSTLLTIEDIFQKVLNSHTYSESCMNLNEINDLSYNLAYKLLSIAHTNGKKLLKELNFIIAKISKYMLINKLYSNNLYFKPISSSSFLEIKKNLSSLINTKIKLESTLKNKSNEEIEEEKKNGKEEQYKDLKEINHKLLEYLKYIALEKEKIVLKYMKKINLVANKVEVINFYIIKKHIKRLILQELDSNKINFVGRMTDIKEQLDIIMKKVNPRIDYIDNMTFLEKHYFCLKEEINSNTENTSTTSVVLENIKKNFFEDLLKSNNNDLLQMNEIYKYNTKSHDENILTDVYKYVCDKAKLPLKNLKLLNSYKSLEGNKYLNEFLDDNTISCLHFAFRDMYEVLSYIKRSEEVLNKKKNLLSDLLNEVKSIRYFSLKELRLLLKNMQRYLPSNNFYNAGGKKKLKQLEDTESNNASEINNEEKQIIYFKNIKEENFNRIYHEEVRTIKNLLEFIDEENVKMSELETDIEEKILLLNNKLHEGNKILYDDMNNFFQKINKKFMKIDKYLRDKTEILYYMRDSYYENKIIKMKLHSIFSNLLDLQTQNKFSVNGKEKNLHHEQMKNITSKNFDLLKKKNGEKNQQNIGKVEGPLKENVEMLKTEKNQNLIELNKPSNLSTVSLKDITCASAADLDILETVSDVRFLKVKKMGELLFYILYVYFRQLEIFDSFLNQLCDSENYGSDDSTLFFLANSKGFCNNFKKSTELKSEVIKFAKLINNMFLKNSELLDGIKNTLRRIKIVFLQENSSSLCPHVIFKKRKSVINILFTLLKLQKQKLDNHYKLLNDLRDEESDKTVNIQNGEGKSEITSKAFKNQEYLKVQKVKLRCDFIYSIANLLLDKNEKLVVEETKFYYAKKFDKEKNEDKTTEEVKLKTNGKEKTKESKKIATLLPDEIKIDESKELSELLLSKDIVNIEEQKREHKIKNKQLDMLTNENLLYTKIEKKRILFKTLMISINEIFEKIKNKLFKA